MKSVAAGAMLMVAMSGCTIAAAQSGGEEPIRERGTGKTCEAAKAQGLLGRARSDAAGAEAMRLSGAGLLRWIPAGTMVTMDYRSDRLNLHLGSDGRISRVACG